MDSDARRLADKEARGYRDSLQFIRGYEAAITSEGEISQKYLTRRRWVWAIEQVRCRLSVYAPQKERFFAEYYGLDQPLSAREKRNNRMIRLSMELYTGQSTLYKWKEQILDEIILAATQAGVYHPF